MGSFVFQQALPRYEVIVERNKTRLSKLGFYVPFTSQGNNGTGLSLVGVTCYTEVTACD